MWIAVRAKPQAEARAARGIEAAGLGAYYPVERGWVRVGRQRLIVVHPLFSGYVFAHPVHDADVTGVHLSQIDGIVAVLRAADAPLSIPDEIIASLRQAESLGAFDRTKVRRVPVTTFQPGDTVQVTRGPFAGLIARVRSARGRDRMQILVDWVHSLDVPVDSLKHANA
jgi:transcription antitermination factor NusG